MSAVLTINPITCTLGFNTGIDFSTHTQKYATGSDLSIYTAFTDYSECAVLAYPVLASDGSTTISQFTGD